MRQFPSGVWSLPVLPIVDSIDPLTQIGNVLSQVDGEFDFVSAVCIVEQFDEDSKGMKWHSYIYDVRYRGKINPGCPKGCRRYTKGQWMQVEALKLQRQLNYPTSAFVKAMEKESCLR
jgi:hypothetical protein